jgi:GT2 family glycosyltransferase/glycosyltransferase involved in cell wall biosynthesis
MKNHITKVSIIISVYNQWDSTKRCLETIVKNTAGVKYEIIIVDDCSDDEASKHLPKIPDVVYKSIIQNKGFIRNCNKGAKSAKGDVLIFISNGTEVQDGWLSAILDTFNYYHDAGVVGGKLLKSNGSLHEAGGIIWSDGSVSSYGRGDDPLDWQYNYVREVDYVSGVCLAIKKEAWEKCKGFDERYLPGYEELDLCITVREMGYKVYYQPRSVVIYHECINSGANFKSDIKSTKLSNKEKLYNKWRHVLESKHWPANQAFSGRAKYHGKKPAILIVDSIIPEINNDAGSVRMQNIIIMLIKKGFSVTLFSNNKPNKIYAQTFMEMGVEIVEQFDLFEEYIVKRALQYDLVWLARPDVSFTKMDIVRKHMPNSKIVYDNVDLYFIRNQRQSEVEQNTSTGMKANVYKAEELYLNRFADLSVVVTDVEKEVLSAHGISNEALVIPLILQMPELCSMPPEDREGLMFLGAYRHTPNIDAVIWFVKEVLPIIRRTIVGVVFYVLGSHPPEEIMSLQKEGEVEVVGWVEDLDPWFNKSRVFISPLRYGAGAKGKNAQTMSYGLPMVTTSIGAEGMNLIHRKNALISDTAEDFAKAVIELHQSSALWQEISTSSLKHFNQYYSVTNAEEQMEKLYMRLFGSKDIVDFIRPDIRKLSEQLLHKSKITALRRETLNHFLKGGLDRPIFIWGAGIVGIRTLTMLREISCDVEGFIDSSPIKHGEIVSSITIFSESALQSNNHIGKPFVIIGTAKKYYTEIEDKLISLGFNAEKDYITCHSLASRWC